MNKPNAFSKLLIPLLMSVSLMVVTTSAQAAVDMFLKLDGIDGESQDDAHQDWIVITSFSEGVSAPLAAGQTGAGGGTVRPTFSGLTVSKFVDRASPAIRQNLAKGAAIPNAHLVVRRAGTNKSEVFFEILMENVVLTSVSAGGTGGEDRLTENVTLNFSKILWRYTPFVNGNPGTSVPLGWNIEKNAEENSF